MIFLLLASPTFACPTIATGTTSPLDFDVAQVAIVREGQRTTFSVSINPFGNKQDFALVLPVPEVLEQSEVQTLEASIFPTLDGYTAPRHVSDAGCPRSVDSDADADTDSDSDADTDSAVDVEASYLVGDYQITILSATESGALQSWLDNNNYNLPDGSEALLAEYINNGSYFLTARVAETATAADGSPLSPLQISYDSDIFSIPIRLATLNSPGEQDMIIYTIVNSNDGRVGIANYPEFDVPAGCIWGNPNTDDFAAVYDGLYTQAWQTQADAAWTVEFAGGPYSCNPCTGVQPDPAQLLELGFTGNYDDHFMTRIHMRYTPEQADQDLMFYPSMMQGTKVTSFADDYSFNYTCIERFCDGSPTPQENDTGLPTDTGNNTTPDNDVKTSIGHSCADGCNTTSSTSLGAAFGALILALHRRSKQLRQ